MEQNKVEFFCFCFFFVFFTYEVTEVLTFSVVYRIVLAIADLSC